MITDVKKFVFGESTKYVFVLGDNSIIEMAVFSHNTQIHFCLSTQIGCPLGCIHCATTYSPIPYFRNILSDELIEIVNYALSLEKRSGERILSFSGHGEPMLNWKVVNNVKSNFQDFFNDFYITTIGYKAIFEQIIKQKNIDVTFYLSLHGPTDEIRELLLPNCSRYSKIVDISWFIQNYTALGGQVVVNYMLHNENSTIEILDKLVVLINNINSKVTIRFTDYTPIEYDTGIVALSQLQTKKVLQYIEERHLPTSIWDYRYSYIEGEEAKIACGQLRSGIVGKGD